MNTSNITNYKPKDFAELLGVSVKTLQRWDREGILKADRTPTDRRYYTYDQYLQFKGINTENDMRQVVIIQECLQEIKKMIYKIKSRFYDSFVMLKELLLINVLKIMEVVLIITVKNGINC